jgi:hypothetical protein
LKPINKRKLHQLYSPISMLAEKSHVQSENLHGDSFLCVWIVCMRNLCMQSKPVDAATTVVIELN